MIRNKKYFEIIRLTIIYIFFHMIFEYITFRYSLYYSLSYYIYIIFLMNDEINI